MSQIIDLDRTLGFGKHPNISIANLMVTEPKYIASIARAATLRNGRPALYWPGSIHKDAITKQIPEWLYNVLVAIKTDLDNQDRAHKEQAAQAKEHNSFYVGQLDQRIDDTLTCTRIIEFVDLRACYLSPEDKSYKALFTNKDGQVVEAYANSKDQYSVGEAFCCRMTPKSHYINREGTRITRVNRITKTK
jgi:hypothetical protein